MKPRVILDNEVYEKIMHWVMIAGKDEISGFSTVKVEKDGVLRVTDAILVPQKNGAAHTDIDADAVCTALFRLKDSPDEVRCYWHSHVQMPVFWSGTDMTTIRALGANGWILALVFNQKKEARAAVCAKAAPWAEEQLFLDDLAITIAPHINANKEAWDAEFDKNVTQHRRVVALTPYKSAWEDEAKSQGRTRSPNGVWARTPKTTSNGISDDLSDLARPVGMTKREFKKLKKEMRQAELMDAPENTSTADDAFEAATRDIYTPSTRMLPGFPDGYEEEDALTDPGMYDDYGFTQEQRSFLAREGVDYREIDELVASGWDTDDIIGYFEAHAANDIPVADRGRA